MSVVASRRFKTRKKGLKRHTPLCMGSNTGMSDICTLLCRFKDERFDDRSMQADWKSIQAEERRSARLGRSEDEKAELEELARQKVKAAAKKKRPKTGLFVD